MSINTDEKAAEFLDPEAMTSYELCEWLSSFIERLSGSIPVHEARNAWSAAAVLQQRHGSAAIGFKDPDAKRCAEAASRIEGYGAAAALMQAAHKIDDMARQHASQRLMDDLRKLASPRDAIVEERDRLRADNERLTKELRVANELSGKQDASRASITALPWLRRAGSVARGVPARLSVCCRRGSLRGGRRP